MSGIGRFTGKDPWTWQPDDERFISLIINSNWAHYYLFRDVINYYKYTNNNGMKYHDPTGKNILKEAECLKGKIMSAAGKKMQEEASKVQELTSVPRHPVVVLSSIGVGIAFLAAPDPASKAVTIAMGSALGVNELAHQHSNIKDKIGEAISNVGKSIMEDNCE